MAEFMLSNTSKTIYSINLLLDIIGIVLFTALVWATVKHRKLHSNCNLLIGLYGFCCLLSKLMIIVPYLMIMVDSIQAIPIYICALLQFVPTMGAMNIFSLMPVIAFDRMLSIFYPIWYTKRDNRSYLPLMYAVSAIFPLFMSIPLFLNVFENPNSLSRCSIYELLAITDEPLALQLMHNYGAILLNLITVSCYLIMAAKLFCDRAQSSNTRYALFKSLALIMAIQIGGWTVTMSITPILSGYLNPEGRVVLTYLVGCFSSICTDIEVPAIYFTSSDHRKAMQKEFAWIFRLFSTQNAPIGNTIIVAPSPNRPIVSSTSEIPDSNFRV